MPDALTLVRAQLARIIAGNHWDRLRGAQRDLTALIGFIDELGAAPGRAPAPEPDWQHVVREMVRCFDSDASGRTSGALTSWMNSAKATLSGGAPPAARPAEPPPAKEREYARQILLVIGWSFWQSEGVWLGVNAGLNLNALGDTPDECYDCALDASELLLRDLVRAAPPPSEAPRE